MKIAPIAPTRAEAFKHIDAAFEHLAEARRTLTEREFKHYIRDQIEELGHRGFVANIGNMISEAASVVAEVNS